MLPFSSIRQALGYNSSKLPPAKGTDENELWVKIKLNFHPLLDVIKHY